MATDCILISILAFAINFSVADVFAKKFEYEIDATQELVAIGVSNIFASFFSCFTACASLSRTFIQVSTGGRTQVVSIISCIILVLTLYTINTYLYYLPQVRLKLSIKLLVY